MSSEIATREPVAFFLDRFGLSKAALADTVGGALVREADYADLYFEFSTSRGIGLEEGMVKNASEHIAQGVGVRVVAGDKTGYAYSDDVTLESLQLASRTAQAIAKHGTETQAVSVADNPRPHDLYSLASPPIEAPLADELDLLNRIDIEARAFDPRIKNVIASVGSSRVDLQACKLEYSIVSPK